MLVQTAETTVYYRDEFAWIRDFVKKNRDYQAQCITTTIPAERGEFHVSTFRTLKTEKNK